MHFRSILHVFIAHAFSISIFCLHKTFWCEYENRLIPYTHIVKAPNYNCCLKIIEFNGTKKIWIKISFFLLIFTLVIIWSKRRKKLLKSVKHDIFGNRSHFWAIFKYFSYWYRILTRIFEFYSLLSYTTTAILFNFCWLLALNLILLLMQ